MNRAQASVEYLLLCVALILVACLLVRFQSPVTAIARSVEAAMVAHPRPRHPHRGHPGQHHPSPRHACWCAAPRGAE